MSLRTRLNLLITLLFIAVFLGAGVYVIHSARLSVAEETESTARLTLQILEASLSRYVSPEDLERSRHLLERLAQLETTRHLEIIVNRTGSPDTLTPPRFNPASGADAPGWFVRLVRPPAQEIRRMVGGPGLPFTEIIIRADPSDEISEAWRETRGVLVALVAFFLLANLLIYFSLGRDLSPIEIILQGLERIEQGDYDLRLPGFAATELDRISEKFNHMAGVLQASRQENRRLTKRMLEIQEEERRYLAREMHDELGQSLTAMKTMVVSLEKDLGANAGPARLRLRDIAAIAEQTYLAARRMIKRLRPGVLDELGLHTALEELVDAWNSNYGDSFCTLECRGAAGDLDEEHAICVYRTVQEALTNIARHAGPANAHVLLDIQPGGVVLQIRDAGRGFDPAQSSSGLGLSGMRERVESLNGRFALSSAPGAGTCLDIQLPGAGTVVAVSGEPS